MSRTKNDILEIYRALKADSGGRLRAREFFERSGISRRELERVFGASAYTKLQELAGDPPTRLNLTATSLREIMVNYGQLAIEVLQSEHKLPVSAHWRQRSLRPTESGLAKVHGIRWSEFPDRFAAFCADDPSLAEEFKDVLRFIEEQEGGNRSERPDDNAILLDRVCTEIKSWSPAIRRNSEEAYKSELSLFLRKSAAIKAAGLIVREERTDSKCDIALGSKVALELKKAPVQSDYDRCFGQIARHLQTFDRVVAIIFDVSSRDRFEDFSTLVDQYFEDRVRVIRNG